MPLSTGAVRLHLDYSGWASRRLLDAAAALSPEELSHDFKTADRSVLNTLVHIFAADRAWIGRIHGTPPATFLSDSDRHMGVLQKEWPAIAERWKEWSGALTDDRVHETFSYQDLKGNTWTQPYWQVVLHVVNHATHHRGQVAGFLRSLGHKPPSLDLIAFYREQ